MLQCKIFSGSDPADIEKKVNDFFNGHSKMMVHSVLQSSGDSNLFITVFFNVRTRGSKLREAAMKEVMANIDPREIPIN